MYRAGWKGQTQSSMVGGGGRRRYAWVVVGDGQNGTGLAGTKADFCSKTGTSWDGKRWNKMGRGRDVTQCLTVELSGRTIPHLSISHPSFLTPLARGMEKMGQELMNWLCTNQVPMTYQMACEEGLQGTRITGPSSVRSWLP